MAIAAIEQWLKAPEYGSGVQLYVQHGCNAFLKDCFLNRQFPLSRLVKELSALNDAPATVKLEVKVASIKPPFKEAIVPKYKPSEEKRIVKPDPSVPKEIAELEKKWREHYANADVIHRDILQAATKAKRKQMALNVVQNMDIVRDIWYRIQYWRENGTLFKEQVDVVVLAEETLLDTINKVRNLPTYITKAKKQVPGIKDVKRLQGVLANIDQKEAELKAAWDRLKFLDAKIKELGI